MPTDLNLKKSWHPAHPLTQAKLHAARTSALQAAQKTSRLQRERDSERSLEQLQRATGAVDTNLAWMYQSPQDVVQETREAYLLGNITIPKKMYKPGEALREDVLGGAATVPNCGKDMKAKLAQDPLPAILKAQARSQASAAHAHRSSRNMQGDWERHSKPENLRQRSASLCREYNRGPLRRSERRERRDRQHRRGRTKRSQSNGTEARLALSKPMLE